jgi:hypothetical protein
MRFQIGSNIHFLLACQGGKSLKETALLINGEGYPTSPSFGIDGGESGANIPKLREYSQIRSQCFGLPAGLGALCQGFCSDHRRMARFEAEPL